MKTTKPATPKRARDSAPPPRAATPASVDEYIASFPENVRDKLTELRAIIRSVIPEAKECFSYGIPTYDIHGHVVHFAGYKGHVGFYPTPNGIEAFADELAPYARSKGTVRFPLDQPLPKALIVKIVKFRKAEDAKRKQARA